MRRLVAALLVGIALAGAVAAAVVTLHHSSKASVIGGTVEVLVADRLIQQGTTGYVMQPGRAYKAAQVPQSQVLTGAITDSSTLTDKVALRDIPQGAQLTTADFGRGPSCPCLPGPAQRAVVVTVSKEIGGPMAAGSHADV